MGVRWTVALDEARVTLEAGSEELARLAKSFYPDYLQPPEGDPELQLQVHTDGHAVRALSGHPPVERTGLDRARALFLFELLTAERLLRRLPDYVVHAGGVEVGGRALLLTGWGGAGKSSLAAALACRGLGLFGDDVALLDGASGLIRPFRRFIKLLDPVPDLLALPAPESPTDPLWPDSHYFPRELGSHWSAPAPVGWVIFPTYAPDGPAARLEPLSGGEAIRRLMEQMLLADEPGASEFDVLTGALAEARFLELGFSDLHHATDKILDATKER